MPIVVNASGPSPEFLEAIGRVVVTSADMEAVLAHLYAAVLESRLGDFVSQGQAFDTVRQACAAIVDVVPDATPELRQQVHDVLSEAKASWDERNHVVHGQWLLHYGETEGRQVVRPRRLKSPDRRGYTLEDLVRLAGRIELVSVSLATVAEAWRTRNKIEF